MRSVHAAGYRSRNQRENTDVRARTDRRTARMRFRRLLVLVTVLLCAGANAYAGTPPVQSLIVKPLTVIHFSQGQSWCEVARMQGKAGVVCWHGSLKHATSSGILATEGAVYVETTAHAFSYTQRQPALGGATFSGGRAYSRTVVQARVGDTFAVSGTHMALLATPAAGDGPSIGVAYLANSKPIPGSYAIGLGRHYVTALKVGSDGRPSRVWRRSAVSPPQSSGKSSGHSSGSSTGPPVSGTWREYSATISYDAGGGGSEATSTQELSLQSSGSWSFGSSHGHWSVEPIVAADWKRWGLTPYGPTWKLVLTGWNGGSSQGPIETSGGRADFVWIIYHASPPLVQAAATIWLKLGH